MQSILDAGYRQEHAVETRAARGGVRFDWMMIALSTWFLGGLFLDGWAHTHGQVDQTFFTPWHAVLYSGELAVTIFLVVNLFRNRPHVSSWRQALPVGYGLALVGALLWFPGGVGDLIWHTLFGIEQNVEALLSPTHLILATSGFLMVTGPLRAAWHRTGVDNPSLGDQLPMLFSLIFAFSVLTFFTQIAYPLSNLWGVGAVRSSFQEQEQGVISILLDTALLVGAILLIIGRWKLKPGAFTLIFTVNAIAMGFLYDQGSYPLAQVVARAAAGVVADMLYQILQPSVQRPGPLRLFAFAMPIVVNALYFLAAFLTSGIAWSVHLWVGIIVMAGVAGLLLSYVAAPPRVAAANED